MKIRLVFLLVTTGLLLAVAGTYLVWKGLHPEPENAAVANQALPAFRLHTADGMFTEADLRGHWTLLFFGYTHCPDACPTTFAALKEITRTLAAQGLPRPMVVFVSVDPKRDTPQLLDSYAHAFDPDFIGATAADAALAPLTGALGVFYQRADTGGNTHYSVDHTAHLYLIDPEGHLGKTFAAPLDPTAIANELHGVLANTRQNLPDSNLPNR